MCNLAKTPVNRKVPGIATNILKNHFNSREFVLPSLAFKLFARENVAFYTKKDFWPL